MKIVLSIRLSFLMGLLAMARSAAGQEQVGYVPEPLQMRSEALGQLFRNSPLSQSFGLGLRSDWRVMGSRSYSNFWGHDKRYIVDTETRDDQLRADFQPLQDLAFYLGLSERALTRMGTDGMAIGFHDFFGLPQDGRLEAPRDNVRMSIPDYDLNYSLAQKNNIISRQIESGAVWDLAKRFGLYLPMTVGLYGSRETAAGNPYFTGNTDVGLRLSAALPFREAALFATLTFTRFDPAKEIAIPTFRQQWGSVFGGAYRLEAHHEALLQALIYQPMLQDMGQLSRSSYEIHLAYRYRWEAMTFELGLVENIFWVYNSPDWGVSAGLSYHP